MIRLIATDLDNTLLPEGTVDLNPEYYEVIEKLNRKGILFVAASGRHTSNIRQLFDCLKDEVVFLGGNGSSVLYQDRTIDVNELDHDLYLEVLAYMRQTGSRMILSDNPQCVWTDSKDEELVSWIRDGYQVGIELCEDLTAVQKPILKVAMYTDTDAAQGTALVRERFGGRANIMSAGANWVDVVANGADKGSALRKIQSIFKIRPEETIAFGDNGNDIGMLRFAGRSYAVENAREEVKEAADEVIGPMSDDAVLKVLKDLL